MQRFTGFDFEFVESGVKPDRLIQRCIMLWQLQVEKMNSDPELRAVFDLKVLIFNASHP